MFIDAMSYDRKFITDDEEFRDSFSKECFEITKSIITKQKSIDNLSNHKDSYFVEQNDVFWFRFSYEPYITDSDVNYFGGASIFKHDLFIALLYKKAEEFGYELKIATAGANGEPKLIFMKPSAIAK